MSIFTSLRRNGSAFYICGASRSGKTQYALNKVLNAKEKRMLVWDFQGQWQAVLKQQGIVVETITGRAQLYNALKANVRDCVICYTPPTFSNDLSLEFDFFCGAALMFVKEAPATIVCEELAAVTHGGVAKGNWQMLQLQGQKFGGTVVAIIQRAQEGDKTTLTQATEVVLFRQNQKDIDYIEKALNVKRQEIPNRDLFFCKIDKNGKKSLGKIEINAQNPKKHIIHAKNVTI